MEVKCIKEVKTTVYNVLSILQDLSFLEALIVIKFNNRFLRALL